MIIHNRARVTRTATFLGIAGASAVLVAACSTDRAGFAEGEQPIATPDAATPDAKTCGFRCSRDLKKVLKGCEGEEEQVVAECGPDAGCGVDSCVDACSAAAISKGSTGCSFYTLPPTDARYGPGACFAAMIANTWDRPVSVTGAYGGQPLDISKSIYTVARSGDDATYTLLQGPLPPGEVAVVFLSESEVQLSPDATRCPQGTVAALKKDPLRHGTVKTSAFQLTTDAPVAAYSIFPYGGASSQYPGATLLLPVSSWDSRYIAVTAGMFGVPDTSSLNRRTLQIVANEDDTTVSMQPTVDIGGSEEVAPGLTGQPVSWTLTKGQVLQISQIGSVAGSPISSNKPVGVFGGSPCTFIPAGTPFCDLTQQQIAPFSQWGTEYALVPFRSRLEGVTAVSREVVPWSLVGAADGTVLTYDPVKPPGAPETLSAGQIVSFETDALVTVKSQDSKHPFHVSVYMTGSRYGGGTGGGGHTSGDPDMVVVVPTDQFLDRYVFFTDYTFPDTSLTLVRRKTKDGFRPVTLACGGEITGWKPLGAKGEYEYAWVPLTVGFTAQPFAKGACGYGRHEAQSDGPFSVTVWGTGIDASYGYAGGGGSRPINDAPLPGVK